MAQFYAVQTRKNQEESVLSSIVDSGVPGIYAALAPANMSNYVFIEAEEIGLVEEAIQGVVSANKVLPGETSFEEVRGFLQPESDIESFAEGDTVEVTKGAYEGDIARVTGLNPAEEKVTVELRDSPIPVPIELPGATVRKV